MKIVLASSNQGKLVELSRLLKLRGITIVPQSDFSIEDAVEDGDTFTENALIKARHASLHSGLPAIADDSGLAVDYLHGEPGIRSARYSGKHATDHKNIDKLLLALQDVSEQHRAARFHCVIAMVREPDDNDPMICHGKWQGRIAQSRAGSNGFGYDPVFYVPALGCTSAELSLSIKNKHSHRAKALQQLKARLIS